VNWKVYSNVNNGTVLNILNAKEEHRSNLFGFLHNTLGIMNYTNKSGQISYEIKETDFGYIMTINWTSTKLKSETTKYYLDLLNNQSKPTDLTTDWRNTIFGYLQRLVNDCRKVDYNFVQETKEYKASLYCEITFEKLYSFPKGEDKPDENFQFEAQRISVPHELLADLINENVEESLKYFGSDHQKLFNVLIPLEGKEFLADFLIGATYFMYLDMPNKAYSYFQRAIKIAEENRIQLPPVLLDFVGSIEFQTLNNPEEAEQSFIKSMLVGNEEAFLKLAYLYLQQGQNDKKDIALSLAKMGEQILPYDEDETHRMAGYHIVASVYLWNTEFDLAEQAHSHFLRNETWCEENSDIIKPYLLLAIAYDNTNFITNIITDYTFLTKKFPAIFDCWHFNTINPFDNRFKGDFIEVLKQIELTRKIYEINE
jgi:tetratricopeptide (TPR) repeat protein